MRRLGGLLVALGLVVLSGCPREEADFPSLEDAEGDSWRPNDFYLLGASGRVLNVTVGENAAIGPLVNVGRYIEEDGPVLRGVMFGKPVSLSFGPTQVAGLWGSEPLRAEVRRQEKRLHIEGLVRGRIADLGLGPDAITGTIGVCGYDLARRGRIYEGTTSCGGQVELVSLQVPETLAAWGDVASATLVAMLLTR
jgi:hypothetical protein